MNDDIAIKVENLSKSYKLYNKPMDRLKEALHPFKKKFHKDFYALDNISFEIKRGETVGIIGKNGSGKSTLLKIITGVLNPSSGVVRVKGKVSALLELGAGFNPEYTGIQNIYLNGTIMGYTREEMEDRVPSIVEFADIGDFIFQPVKSYSSGMFVRLAFAVAINVEPDILVVDEALSVGDMFFQLKCYSKFKEFKEKGSTILFVTHDMSSIMKYCDYAMVLDAGEKVAVGDTKKMVDYYKMLLVNIKDNKNYYGINNIDIIDKVQEGNDLKWKDCVVINPNCLCYGNNYAEICDYGVFNIQGKPENVLSKGDTYIIKMRVKFTESIKDPIYALSIKDKKGVELVGTNSIIEKIETGVVEPGDRFEITFAFPMYLQIGEYYISLGCTGINGKGDLIVYHRLYDIFGISVVAEKVTVGIFDMQIEERIEKM